GVPQPNGDDADLTLNVTSHEHMEAITDPFGNAWFDTNGAENGDRCAWTFGAPVGGSGSSAYNQVIGSGHYMLQLEWSNAAGACVGSTLTVSNGTWSPAPTGYEYSWRRCSPSCSTIAGASGQTYQLTSSDQ